jgi:AcrR family transcriptional regulator
MDHKQRILIKAEELFMRYGIRSVSMDDIAINLGMSKKTLYQYYVDKDALVEAVVDLHIDKMEVDCSSCRKEASNAIHEIFITMKMIMEEFSNMNPMLLHDLEKFHFKAFQRFREHKDKFLFKVVKDNIEWGIKDELYRDDVSVEVMTRYRIETMLTPFNVLVFPPAKFNVVDTSRLMLENFTYGLSTIKGYKLIQKYNQQRLKNQNHENR